MPRLFACYQPAGRSVFRPFRRMWPCVTICRAAQIVRARPARRITYHLGAQGLVGLSVKYRPHRTAARPSAFFPDV